MLPLTQLLKLKLRSSNKCYFLTLVTVDLYSCFIFPTLLISVILFFIYFYLTGTKDL